ncbi:hypothetical protein [Kamptonema formosum]|uniref:hypothetical protein n=1 Tax=Kamptonema formosum TaxID=331992 RepID=UPI00034A470D|nr:hypothetical protein [Oscillatoria sp. PCC 10802]
MNNPFDDTSQSGSHSPVDDLMQSLSLDSHRQSNPQPSEDLDSSHLSLNLGQSHFSLDLHPAGAPEGSEAYGHSLTPLSGALDSGSGEGLDEIKPELTDSVAPEIPASSSAILNSDGVQTEWHSSGHSSEQTALLSQVEATPNVLHYTDSGAITPEDKNSVEFIGNSVWWHGYGWGQAGTVEGHKFYRGGDYIGRLGADMNVYDAGGHKIGYVTPSGCAYSTDGQLFATGITARWAAATLVFNTCTQS